MRVCFPYLFISFLKAFTYIVSVGVVWLTVIPIILPPNFSGGKIIMNYDFLSCLFLQRAYDTNEALIFSDAVITRMIKVIKVIAALVMFRQLAEVFYILS